MDISVEVNPLVHPLSSGQRGIPMCPVGESVSVVFRKVILREANRLLSWVAAKR